MWSELAGVFFLVSYVGYTTTTLIKASAPPLCSSDDEVQCLKSGMPRGSPYAVHLFVSRQVPTELAVKKSPLTSQNTLSPTGDNIQIGTAETAAGFEDDCDLNVVYGNGVTEPDHRPWYKRILKSRSMCETKIFFDVPAIWHDNATSLYLTTTYTDITEAGYTRITFPVALAPVSLHYRPEKKDLASKRLLLKHNNDATSEHTGGESFIGVPRLVHFGPISAFDNFDKRALMQLGRSHWLRPAPENVYFAEGQINSYVSPRDEYLPLASVSDRLLKRKKLLLADGTRRPTRMTFVLGSTSWRKNAINRLLMNAISTMESKFGTNQYESDSLKLLFAGNSPIILLVTFSVSVLHMLFEFLAMISNWYNFKEQCQDHEKSEAVSATAILLDTVFETLILLWLFDDGEARLIQIMLLIKIVYNSYRFFKLSQVQKEVEASTNPKVGVLALLKQIHPIDAFRPAVLAEKRKSMRSDDFEIWTLICQSSLLSVIFSMWVVYQLYCVPQKSWTSAIIKLGAHLAYGGGFIAMTPQLYKNYYHRTVAHLPWIALTYNFLNTIIDDLFSFLIRMPKEHRISVFRDDIIFIVYWLQKWHYKKEHEKIAALKNTEDIANANSESISDQPVVKSQPKKRKAVSK